MNKHNKMTTIKKIEVDVNYYIRPVSDIFNAKSNITKSLSENNQKDIINDITFTITILKKAYDSVKSLHDYTVSLGIGNSSTVPQLSTVTDLIDIYTFIDSSINTLQSFIGKIGNVLTTNQKDILINMYDFLSKAYIKLESDLYKVYGIY
jgi:hypothetical protein